MKTLRWHSTVFSRAFLFLSASTLLFSNSALAITAATQQSMQETVDAAYQNAASLHQSAQKAYEASKICNQICVDNIPHGGGCGAFENVCEYPRSTTIANAFSLAATAWANATKLNADLLAAESVPDGEIYASGCTLGSNGSCSSRVTWMSSNATNVKVYVASANTPKSFKLMSEGLTGRTTASWITKTGDIFQLRSDQGVLDSYTLMPNVPSGVITATRCKLGSNGLCTSHVVWTSANATHVQVYVAAGEKPNEFILMSDGSKGTAAARWIAKEGDIFQLRSDQGVLATTTMIPK